MPTSRSLFPTSLVLAVLATTACADAGPPPADTAPTPDPLAAYRPSPQQEAGALAVVQTLFDALGSGNAELMRSVMDPSVVMHFSETRDGTTTFGSATVDALADRLVSSDVALIERMWDPVVVVNGPLATVWTPYDFYAGSEFSHCGVDVATVMDTADGWKIVALSWTRLQPPACELNPDGPPRA
jgi:hypothetical protein